MQRVAAHALADQPLEIVLANFAATTLDDFAASGLALRFVNEYVEENAQRRAVSNNALTADEHESAIRLIATIFMAWLVPF